MIYERPPPGKELRADGESTPASVLTVLHIGAVRTRPRAKLRSRSDRMSGPVAHPHPDGLRATLEHWSTAPLHWVPPNAVFGSGSQIVAAM